MATSKKDIILVIDDEPDLREMVQYQFQAKGFAVIAAANGMEGMEKLRTITPDLIILDMNMPKMGGIEFYQQICGPDGRPKYPVLVLTARANLEQLFKDFDIDGFMSKPFDVDDLIKQGATIIAKAKRGITKSMRRDSGAPKRVFVVENDPEALKQIEAVLKKSGCVVESAPSGAIAIEKMMASPPDVALIKLGLSDVAGDIVAFRLKKLSLTCDVTLILYVPVTDQLDADVLDLIGEKGRVATIVKYSSHAELAEAVGKCYKEE